MRRILKWLSVGAAGLVGLVVLSYAALVVINWSDEAPSAKTSEFLALVEDVDPFSDDNAVPYFAGLAAPQDEDPRELGSEWLRWSMLPYEQQLIEVEPEGEAMWPQAPCRKSDFRALAKACSDPGEDCFLRLDAESGLLELGFAEVEWMLQRYDRLLEYPAWREPFAKSYMSVLPYSEAMNLNQLHGLFAWHVGQSGDPQRALDMLDQEAGFWRRVLAGSNTIIGRVIAAAALERNLQWTNAVLREALPEHALSVPKSWRQALTPEERDWRPAFAGEIHLMTELSEWFIAEADASVLDVLVQRIQAPLFQPTATLNYAADRYYRVDQVLSVPYRELPHAVDALRRQGDEEFEKSGIFSAYNPVGHVLARISTAYSTANYGLRITDLEGVRRMLLLATELRANGIAEENIQSHANASEIRNPYTGSAFSWDADAASFTFTGIYPWGEDGFMLMY